MCEAKSTPGPWLSRQAEVVIPDKEFNHLIHTTDLRHVAEVFQYQNDEHVITLEEARANACLIAKSPDMLLLLRKCIDEQTRYNGVSLGTVMEIERLVEAIDNPEGPEEADHPTAPTQQ